MAVQAAVGSESTWGNWILFLGIVAGRRVLMKVQGLVDFIPARFMGVYDAVLVKIIDRAMPYTELPMLWALEKGRPLLKYADQSRLSLLRKDIEEVLDHYSSSVQQPAPLIPLPTVPTPSVPSLTLPKTPSLPVANPNLRPSPTKPSARENEWKINVQVLVKKASGGSPALYFPHNVWFEPETKRLYWQANGDDQCMCDGVAGVKIMNKVALTLSIALATADSFKVLKFKEAALFKSWHDRLAAALGQSG